MFIVIIRTFTLYFIVIFIMRIMGKRSISQFEPYELAITLMISEVAALPMQDMRIPILHGIVPIITLGFFQAMLALIQLKFKRVRFILNGKPSIVIRNGVIDAKELKDLRFSIDDLMEEIRLMGYLNVEDIQIAILEISGQLSVFPKSSKAPLEREDLKIKKSEDSIPITLIMDRKICHESLKVLNKDENWLLNKLYEKDIKSYKDVFLAILNSSGNLYIQLANK
ncbi:MAG: DUF421 domain-containing protein [Oscillospiraceae bacterium]|nr:DUF421 domain-containing protein [Oscillospiraceae bacterium]